MTPAAHTYEGVTAAYCDGCNGSLCNVTSERCSDCGSPGCDAVDKRGRPLCLRRCDPLPHNATLSVSQHWICKWCLLDRMNALEIFCAACEQNYGDMADERAEYPHAVCCV